MWFRRCGLPTTTSRYATPRRWCAGMSDAGWILGAYVIVLGGVALYAIRIVTRGRSLAKQVPDEDKTWT